MINCPICNNLLVYHNRVYVCTTKKKEHECLIQYQNDIIIYARIILNNLVIAYDKSQASYYYFNVKKLDTNIIEHSKYFNEQYFLQIFHQFKKLQAFL